MDGEDAEAGMGLYLNPGKGLFQMALNSEIYVDKSGIIRELNRLIHTEQRFVCVSRPRRFGKTITGNMLCSYYGIGADSREHVVDLAIADDVLTLLVHLGYLTYDEDAGTVRVPEMVQRRQDKERLGLQEPNAVS